MKRLKVVLAFALALAMMVTISVAPALANDNGLDCKNRPGPFIKCDGDRFVDVDRADNLFGHRTNHGFDCFGCGYNRFHYDHFSPYVFSPYVFSPYVFGCWEWDGDEWEWDDDCD
jgi:hypothetical protein